MSREHRTTEFSAHISRSKMRRYLHDELTAHAAAEVETHLKHCARCSQSIIQYIEEEEPENYKLHIKKLKGIIVESVKPQGPRFSTLQVKSLRAAAAVVILVAFSFFAFENLIEKDFSLVAKSEKEGPIKRNNVFPEDAQKKTTKVALTQPTKDTEDKEVKAEPKMEKAAEVKVAPKKKSVKKAEPKTEPKAEVMETVKPQVAVKKEVKEQPESVQSGTIVSEVPQVTENTAQDVGKPEEVNKAEEITTLERTSPVAQVEAEKTKQETVTTSQPVAPIQKLEKAKLNEGSNNLTKEEPVQVVPNASVGQFLQRD